MLHKGNGGQREFGECTAFGNSSVGLLELIAADSLKLQLNSACSEFYLIFAVSNIINFDALPEHTTFNFLKCEVCRVQ